MPVYTTTQSRRADFPPQYLEPKYEQAMEYPGFHLPSDSDYFNPDPYNHNKHMAIYPAYFEPMHGAPMIQPLQIDSRYNYQPQQVCPPVQDEKIVGGVSAKLDYDMEQITDFVLDMAVSIVRPGLYDRPLFRKWVLQVLNATRLPSATIILSLSYLAMRVRGLVAEHRHAPTERGLYQMLTVALILGSKFLDDNTFQNKSWAEVSNIAVTELNRDEVHWLLAFRHHLHHDPAVPEGFDHWQAKWQAFKKRPVAITLHPLDTSSRARQSSSPSHYAQYSAPMSSTLSPMSSDPNATYLPSLSPYDAWYGRTSNRSPSTASHTGPTTPEYYDARWRVQPTEPLRAHSISPSAHFSAYDSIYNFAPSIWSCHGHECQCANCRHGQVSRFGSVAAA